MSNTNNAIFNLMQNIVDKLNDVEKKLNTREEDDKIDTTALLALFDSKIKNIHTQINELVKLFQNESLSSKKARKEMSDKLKEVELIPIVNNTNNEYSLIGSKSIFKPKQLIVFMVLLVVVWSSIKYIPPYLNEKSNIKERYEEYQILTNYIYFMSSENNKDFMNSALDKIKKKDTVFMNQYHKLMDKHQIELRKQELQEKLKSLEQ